VKSTDDGTGPLAADAAATCRAGSTASAGKLRQASAPPAVNASRASANSVTIRNGVELVDMKKMVARERAP
jgi:hypothetical protein